MPKRASSRLVKTQGKRAKKLASDDLSDDPTRDTDFEDDESDPEEQRSPPRKRQRTAAKSAKTPFRKQQVKGKSSRVVGLADMPIGIFIKIASYLEPIDIIFLARLNKHFRNLLMRRSSVNIWQASMDNVPFLPDCPPDMSEPNYLALVFLKTCTSCGKAGKTEIDEVLRVRLCGACRKTSLIVWNTVPPGIMALIPFSGKIAPNPRRSHAYSLRADVPGLVAESEKVKRLNNKEAHQAWAAEKRDIVQKRREHAQLLRVYLEMMDLVREQEIDDTKVDRQEEIERRLEEMGWTAEDMDFDYLGCTNKRAWVDLVSQPKPLTDRGWPSLKSKLVALLEDNRKQRLEVGRRTRKEERQTRLLELFRAIKDKGCFTIEIPVPTSSAQNSDSAASSTSASYAPPFPDFSHMLHYPVVLDLYETDRSVAEMETKFEERRKEIEGHSTEWTNRVQAHFTKLALEGPKITKKSLLSTSIARDMKPNPLVKLPDNVKRLLRADSLFNTPSVLKSGENLTYGSILKFHDLSGTHTSTLPASARVPPDLDDITWDAEANKVARELLASMGKPNASYLEMTDKAIYACGRCHDTEVKTWEQIVYHYAHHNGLHSKTQEDLDSTGSEVTLNNIHDPKLLPKQPLVQYASGEPEDESDKFECKLCAVLLTLEEVVTTEAKVLKHLRDVHEITKPEDEHYGSLSTESDEYGSGRYDSDDGYYSGRYSDDGFYGGYSDEFSDEGGGCGYARRRMAGYGRYGGRRKNRHYYSRPRCVYYADGDDDWW